MVGDQISDIVAGFRAGCRTVLIQSSAADEPPSVVREPVDKAARPDYVCADLEAAAEWILSVQ